MQTVSNLRVVRPVLFTVLVSCNSAPPIEVVALPPADTAEFDQGPSNEGVGGSTHDAPGEVGPPPSQPVSEVRDLPSAFSDDQSDPLVEITVDDQQVCGRRQGGDVWCWGQILTGPTFAGDMTRVVRSGPEPWKLELPAPAVRLVSGASATCAQLDDETVHCWGGDGPRPGEESLLLYSFPAAVTRPPTEVTVLAGSEMLAIGESSICRLLRGTIQCFGGFALVDGVTAVEVGDLRAIELNAHHDYETIWSDGLDGYCARRIGGRVDCVDFVGYIDAEGTLMPGGVAEIEEFEHATEIAGSFRRQCALVDGEAVCRSRYGFDTPPTQPDASPWVKLIGGRGAVCGLTASGRVECYGNNERGDLGRGFATSGDLSVESVVLADEVVAVSAADRTFCALTRAHAVACWGGNDAGVLGRRGWSPTPTLVEPVAVLTDLFVGERSACGLDGMGQVHCWGQVQSYIGPCLSVPTAIGMQASGRAPRLVAGPLVVCVTADDGALDCGSTQGVGNRPLQGPIPFRPTTTSRIAGLDVQPGDVLAVQANGGCVARGERLRCFLQTYTGGPAEVDDAVLPGRVRDLILSAGTGCILFEDGEVRCTSAWFDAFSAEQSPADTLSAASTLFSAAPGRLGMAVNGSRVCVFDAATTECTQSGADLPVPSLATPEGTVSLALGGRHGCFLTAGGEVLCWGSNDVGQLGTGAALDAFQAEPEAVPGLGHVVRLAARDDHTCASNREGRIHCWGDNPAGVIGLEPLCHVPVPTALTGP